MIEIFELEDWQVLYIDGEFVYEGHQIPWDEILKDRLGYGVEWHTPNWSASLVYPGDYTSPNTSKEMVRKYEWSVSH